MTDEIVLPMPISVDMPDYHPREMHGNPKSLEHNDPQRG